MGNRDKWEITREKKYLKNRKHQCFLFFRFIYNYNYSFNKIIRPRNPEAILPSWLRRNIMMIFFSIFFDFLGVSNLFVGEGKEEKEGEMSNP